MEREQPETGDRVRPQDVAPPQQPDVEDAEPEQHQHAPRVQGKHRLAALLRAEQLRGEPEPEQEGQERLGLALDGAPRRTTDATTSSLVGS